jgi:hypothetical protein
LAASSLARRFQARRCRGNSPRFRGESPLNETLRRLIGSSVVVGPASVSRRHERPPRIAVSRRSGKSRPPRWAARLQARVGSGSASPPPVEPTNLASSLSVLPVWPGAPCACWPTRRCCQVGTLPGGAIRPNFRGTDGCRRNVLGSATPSEDPWCVRACPLGGASLPTGCAARAPLLHCAVRWQTHIRKTARPLTTLGGVEPL